MQSAFTPLESDDELLAPGSLWVSLPSEAYVVPATLAPMLLYVLTGDLVVVDAASDNGHPVSPCTHRLPRFSVCGGTRSVRRLQATPGAQVLLTPVRVGRCLPLLGLHAGELFEQLVDAAELLPATSLERLHGQMEAVLLSAGDGLAVARAAMGVWHGFLHALRQADGLRLPRDNGLVVSPDWLNTPVSVLAQQFGLSVRQFERRFLTTHGQNLRAYRQQSRCSRLLTQAAGVLHQPLSWADTAASAGYADQAHLCRDILRFTGHTPASLQAGVRARDPALWPFHLSPLLMPRWFGPHGY